MPLGVLMLDTRFRRFVGDIGNPQSYREPVLFEVVRGATVDKVVPAKAPPLIDDFVAAGERLVARGASAITTGCGFLVLNQAELAARLPVPVATSALLLIPSLMKLLPAGKRLGVLTFSARDLTRAHFAAAGAPEDTPVEGVAQGGVFQKLIHDQIEFRRPFEIDRVTSPALPARPARSASASPERRREMADRRCPPRRSATASGP